MAPCDYVCHELQFRVVQFEWYCATCKFEINYVVAYLCDILQLPVQSLCLNIQMLLVSLESHVFFCIKAHRTLLLLANFGHPVCAGVLWRQTERPFAELPLCLTRVCVCVHASLSVWCSEFHNCERWDHHLRAPRKPVFWFPNLNNILYSTVTLT